MAKQKKKTAQVSKPEPANEEYERFLEFGREIFSVPKSEIDRRQAEYEANKKPTDKGISRTKMMPPK